jgi:hypothetical protein
MLAVGAGFALSIQAFAQSDPLPSWNDGATKSAINEFVHATTDQEPKIRATGGAHCHFRSGWVAGHQGRQVHSGVIRRSNEKGWVVFSMKNDWKRLFSFENSP